MGSLSHAAIEFQRMRPFGSVSNPSGPPLLGVYQILNSVIEGNILSFQVRRSRNVLGDLTFQYNIVSSSGSSADFVGTTSGNLTMTTDQLTRTISVNTAVQSGTQGDRVITCTISAISGCEIDPTRSQVNSLLKDPTTTTNWFKDLVYRSTQPLAQGVANFENPPKHWTQYETECNFVDSFNGDHFGNNNAFIQTWDQVQGGPLGNPSAILSNGQLSWFSQASDFSTPFLGVPVNKAWVWHSFTVVPVTLRTDSGVTADRSAVWDQIIAGTHDQRFIDFGARIAALFAQRGYDLKYYIGCMCPRPQQHAIYRVYNDTITKFRDACDRVYAKIRQGAAYPTLRFAFSVANFRRYLNEDYGELDDWTPSTCDVIATSFHPDAFVINKNTYNQMINGNANYYGLLGDIMALCSARGLPMGIQEWSPSYNSCKIANDVYGWFYDEFLVPYANQLVASNVYGNQTFDPHAADKQGAGPAAQWALGVNTFKAKWGTTTIRPQAVLSITANVTGQQVEGTDLIFNVARSATNSQACSVTWQVTSTGILANDVDSPISGTIAFSDTETVASKQVTVSTVPQTGTQNNRTITVTISAAVNATINNTKSNASNVIIDFTPPSDAIEALFHRPFSKAASCNRPLGAAGVWQVQGGVELPNTLSGTGANNYVSNKGPVYDSTMLSPLVNDYGTALPNSGMFGAITCKTGDNGVKFMYFNPGDPAKRHSVTTLQTNSNSNLTEDWPNQDYITDPAAVHDLVFADDGSNPASPSGDNEYIIFPSDGNQVIGETASVYNNLYKGGQQPGQNCRTVKFRPLNGLDTPWRGPGTPQGPGGDGGSGYYFPSGFLRLTEVDNRNGRVPFIGHRLTGTLTRQNHNNDQPKSSILMGGDLLWPAVSRDGSAYVPSTPPSTAHPNGLYDNIGFLGYGQILAIPEWLAIDAIRNSTTTNSYVYGPPYGTFALNLTDIGKALFDAFRVFGFAPFDGSGVGVGPQSAYGRIEVRVDQGISTIKDAGGTLFWDLVNIELSKICPPRPAVGGDLTRWKQNLLFPFAGARKYAEDNEQFSDGFYYAGGGGKKYPDSNSNATV